MTELENFIIQLPIPARAATIMFIIWIIYTLLSPYLAKVMMYILGFINFICTLIYKLANGVIHIAHHNYGKAFIDIDQTITDLFCSIYNFFNNLKLSAEKYTKTKMFVGLVFFVCVALTIWISIPIWLHIENDTGLLTAACVKYLKIENSILNIVFSKK